MIFFFSVDACSAFQMLNRRNSGFAVQICKVVSCTGIKTGCSCVGKNVCWFLASPLCVLSAVIQPSLISQTNIVLSSELKGLFILDKNSSCGL